MNWIFSLNNILYVLRTTFLFKYEYHCNICGYPTNDVNQLYTHGINSHQELLHTQLIRNNV